MPRQTRAVRHQIARRDPLCQGRVVEPELRQIVHHRLVEIEFPLIHKLPHHEGRKSLRRRTDRKNRFVRDRKLLVRIAKTEPLRVDDLIAFDDRDREPRHLPVRARLFKKLVEPLECVRAGGLRVAGPFQLKRDFPATLREVPVDRLPIVAERPGKDRVSRHTPDRERRLLPVEQDFFERQVFRALRRDADRSGVVPAEREFDSQIAPRDLDRALPLSCQFRRGEHFRPQTTREAHRHHRSYQQPNTEHPLRHQSPLLVHWNPRSFSERRRICCGGPPAESEEGWRVSAAASIE